MIASRAFLAPALLGVGALLMSVVPASAQSQAETNPAPVVSADAGARPDATDIKVMGRWLMERVEAHRVRLLRLDKLLDFYRANGDLAKIREIERLRQREINAFQTTLSEYRSQLGNQQFERLARAVRYLMDKERKQRAGVWNKDGDGLTRERAAAAREATAQSRQQQGNRSNWTRRGPVPSTERSLDRQLEIERARASQRMQLAQRLQQARQQQLRLMAEQQRRYRPSAGPAPQGGGPVRPSAGEAGGSTRRPAGTQQRPPQRPQRRPR
jgi:hypothetical protein